MKCHFLYQITKIISGNYSQKLHLLLFPVQTLLLHNSKVCTVNYWRTIKIYCSSYWLVFSSLFFLWLLNAYLNFNSIPTECRKMLELFTTCPWNTWPTNVWTVYLEALCKMALITCFRVTLSYKNWQHNQEKKKQILRRIATEEYRVFGNLDLGTTNCIIWILGSP